MRRDCESRRAGDHVLLVRTNEFSTEVYIIRPEGTDNHWSQIRCRLSSKISEPDHCANVDLHGFSL